MLLTLPGIYVGCAILLAAVLGLAMGSFLGRVAWRLMRNEPVLAGRSHCDTCGHVLFANDLVPIVSWTALRGRCRYCHARLSARYPASEFACAALYVSIVICYGLTLEALQMVGFASVLMVLSLTDLDESYIPNQTIVAAIVIRVLFIVFAWLALVVHVPVQAVFADPAAHGIVLMDAQALGFDDKPFWDPTADASIVVLDMLRTSLLGAVIIGVAVVVLALAMDKFLGRSSIGGGDMKLFAVAGFYFGARQCLFLIVIACVLGILFALATQNRAGFSDDIYRIDQAEGKSSVSNCADEASQGPVEDEWPFLEEERVPASKGVSRVFPFGPSIALACWITMMVGGPVTQWYLELF